MFGKYSPEGLHMIKRMSAWASCSPNEKQAVFRVLSKVPFEKVICHGKHYLQCNLSELTSLGKREPEVLSQS